MYSVCYTDKVTRQPTIFVMNIPNETLANAIATSLEEKFGVSAWLEKD